jgi:hypothetical protein
MARQGARELGTMMGMGIGVENEVDERGQDGTLITDAYHSSS